MKGLVVVFMIVFLMHFVLFASVDGEKSTLKQVHVVFRHGDRTAYFSYPKDPHSNQTYPPYGVGQLTNKGKTIMYLLGRTLRGRNDDLLGNSYTPDVLDGVCTQVDRTKASLELVLAGLYPKGANLSVEEALKRQPIPYRPLLFKNDHIMSPPLYFCSYYIELYREYSRSKEGLEILNNYQDLLLYLSQNTGLYVESLVNVTQMYDLLMNQEEWGLQLPEWTSEIYPEFMKEAAMDAHVFGTATLELTQLTSFLLDKIVKDTRAAVNRTENRKVFLYSGHDYTVVHLLNSMNGFFRHLPAFGAYILVELHEVDRDYFIKVFYQDYSQSEPRALRLVGCEQFCAFEKFLKLVERNLPAGDDMCEHKYVTASSKNEF